MKKKHILVTGVMMTALATSMSGCGNKDEVVEQESIVANSVGVIDFSESITETPEMMTEEDIEFESEKITQAEDSEITETGSTEADVTVVDDEVVEVTPTSTPTPTPTEVPATPTSAPVVTEVPTATPVPTAVPTATPIPTVAPTATPVLTEAPVTVSTPYYDREMADQIIAYLNADRAAIGLCQLSTGDSTLQWIADQRAIDITTVCTHDAWKKDPKYAYSEGENIGYHTTNNTAWDIYNAYKNSAGHDATMTLGTYDQVAVSVYYANGQIWTTMEFRCSAEEIDWDNFEF